MAAMRDPRQCPLIPVPAVVVMGRLALIAPILSAPLTTPGASQLDGMRQIEWARAEAATPDFGTGPTGATAFCAIDRGWNLPSALLNFVESSFLLNYRVQCRRAHPTPGFSRPAPRRVRRLTRSALTSSHRAALRVPAARKRSPA